MLVADVELVDPSARTARPDAQPKAGQVIIEEDRLALAGRKLDRGERFLGELHGRQFPGWEDHGKTAAAVSRVPGVHRLMICTVFWGTCKTSYVPCGCCGINISDACTGAAGKHGRSQLRRLRSLGARLRPCARSR